MKVLIVHNRYTQPGGEDLVVAGEAALLRRHGVEVRELIVSNEDVLRRGRLATVRALALAARNPEGMDLVGAACREFRPDVAHVHNFWFALSAGVHEACRAEGAATVQTLHNFRLLCANALLMRDFVPCRECVERGPWRGVLRRCYHGSLGQSWMWARMVKECRRSGMWERDVDAFIALTESSRALYVAGGLPAERIAIKPNFVEDPGVAETPGRGAVMVGRLSPEKGPHTLVRAWREVAEVPLTIVGDGPLRGELEAAVAQHGMTQVRFAGHRDARQCMEHIRAAAFLVFPSQCYETFGRAIVEAYAAGRPVVASRLGAMAELVQDGRTGLLFEPGDAADLAAKARRLAAQPELCREMGRAARAEYEKRYRPEENFRTLTAIYETALRRRRDAGAAK
jgi:glycosyltransferase involved in cell wall biosynthesis